MVLQRLSCSINSGLVEGLSAFYSLGYLLFLTPLILSGSGWRRRIETFHSRGIHPETSYAQTMPRRETDFFVYL